MNVIRESPRMRKRRQDLQTKQRELVNMNFDTKRKSEMLSFINSFMLDKKIIDQEQAHFGVKFDEEKARKMYRTQTERQKVKSIYRP